MTHKPKSSHTRLKLQLLCILLALILAAMLFLTGSYIRSGADAASFAAMTNIDLDAYLASGDTPAWDPQSAEAPTIGGSGSRIVNILLVGQDRRENEGRTRADSMILCTFNKQNKELILTSFLRDLYVDIPGHGSDRINAAYSYGGMDLLEETLENNFLLQIDGTVEVDFTQFAEIVDLLGGVDMDLRDDEAAFINDETGSTLTGGVQHLRGDQALAYSRIRKLDADGDFSRTSRQRKVMSALLDSYRDANLPTVVKLMSQLMPMVTTDLSTMDIMGYALELFPMLSGAEMRQQRIPAEGTYSDQKIDGKAVLVPDLEAARQVLAQTLLGA